MIPTPDQRLRVFVSSTLGELAAERAAARAAVEALRLTPVMAETGGSGDGLADHADLLRSDVFVGIYWASYGSVPPGGQTSGLEDEFRVAAPRSRLLYLKEPAPERDPRLAALIDEMRRSGLSPRVVSGASDVGDQLTRDLALLMADRYEPSGRRLPAGTVTFLFADIQGSTAGLEEHGEPYADLLVRFRRDAEQLVHDAGGATVRTEGDGAFAAFPAVDAAVQAAVDLQHAFRSYPSPGPLAVRMGLHTGNGVVVDDDYVGLDVHRAARVAAAAHGGQILVSSSAHELIRLPAGGGFTDLGWYRLKGIGRPEHLFQLDIPGLPGEFPVPAAVAVSRAGMPVSPTPILGREADIEAVAALLAAGTRLLTLIGPGGIGKTRLALAVGEQVGGRYRDGTVFVDLASVTDAALVPEVVAAALGRAIEGSAGGEEVIVDELRDREFLLILDNFEQVVDAGSSIAYVLAQLPRLQVLVTSRTALRLSAEREYPVEPLGLPRARASADEIAAAPAVRLLVDRAHTVRPGLVLNEANAEALAELARRLDGIPLALELAAARLRLLGPADVLARLDTPLDLAGGVSDLPGRQRTMRSTIDWSFRLLPEAEQVLFRRLGVFAAGWTLEAAEEIAGDEHVPDVAAGLETLAAHSLIRLEDRADGGVGMRMLVPLRDYARTLLADSAEEEVLRDRHAGYFVSTLHTFPRGEGDSLGRWAQAIHRDWDDLMAVGTRCMAIGDAATLARMLRDLWGFIFLESRYDVADEWVRFVRPHLAELELPLQGSSLFVDAFVAMETGRFDHAMFSIFEALAKATDMGDALLEADCKMIAASILPSFDLLDARIERFAEEAIAAFRARGALATLGYCVSIKATHMAALGRFDEAFELAEEGIEIGRRVPAMPLEAQIYALTAFISLLRGDAADGEVRLDKACRALERRHSHEVLTYVLDGYGWLGLMRGLSIPAMTVLGAAEGIRARLGLNPWPIATVLSSMLTALVDSYADVEAQAARKAGRELSPATALGLARTEILGARPAALVG